MAVGWRIKQRYLADERLPMPARSYPIYMVVVWLGAVGGAFGVGTLNLSLSGMAGTGRSIIGALAGGILVAEIYKLAMGVRGSTGIVFVVPLALAIAIGRIGCFFGGLADFTYGSETTLPWGVDFGDGIGRHPVQLYESLAMAMFLTVFLWLLHRHRSFCLRNGFYLFIAIYAAQRFAWEWLKPYGAVAGPLNLFHLICLLLIAYAAVMTWLARRIHAPA